MEVDVLSGTGGALRDEGVPAEVLLSELVGFKGEDFDWRRGRLPSYTYFFRDEVLDVQRQAYVEYIVENAQAVSRVLGSVPRMLADIRSWTVELFNAPADAGFSFTSGGTESVLAAVKTCRDRAQAVSGEQRGYFNIVAPVSAHPALNKAAELMDIEVRRVAVAADRRSDVEAMTDAMDDRTIMIYASAPSYPFGLFDRIEELGELARQRQVWLHIDACWGGFISPFARELGYPIPPFDLAIPGVTSISADLHKFGFTAKGASIVLYRDPTVQQYERFTFQDWPRGTYRTPTLTGSKPAGPIAAAWAVMQFLGKSGYRQATEETMQATRSIAAGAAKIPGLAPLDDTGESNLLNIISTDETVNIMAVATELENRGWFRGLLREPQAIHQGVNPAHLPVVEEYLTELEHATTTTRQTRATATYDEHTY